MSCYIHNVPGRLRIKIPFIKGNENTAEDVKRLLKNIDGIDSTAVNTLTGSIIVNYNWKAVNSESIIDALTQEGYVDPNKTITNDQYLEKAITRAGGVFSKALLGLCLEKAFEASALSLLTVLI